MMPQITVGSGLTRPQGQRLDVRDVEDLARALREQPPAVEAWWAPHVWRNDTRDSDAWEGSCAIAVDLDRAGHEDLDAELADRLDEAARGGGIPGSIYHRTPAGARVVFVLDQVCTDAEAFTRAAEGAACAVQANLSELSIDGVKVDPKPHRDLARLFFTPNSVAKGVRRSAEVLVLVREPYTLAALEEHRPIPEPIPIRVAASARPDAEKRATAYVTAMGPSIEGQRGDDHAFRVAAALVNDFALPSSAAWSILCAWNQTCHPPWTERDLRRFISSAEKNAKHPPGAKLLEDRPAPPARPVAEPPGDPPEQGLDSISIATTLLREETRLEHPTPRIPTGFPRLDRAIGGGLEVPSMTIVGAGPKSGKSTWAQIIAVRHAEAGGVAYVLDLENGSRRFLRRILCRKASLGPSQVSRALEDERAARFHSRADAEQWRGAKAWLREVLAGRLFVEHSPPKDFVARVAAARAAAGDRKLLIVVDSLQKLPGDPRDDRRTTIDKWIRLFEDLRYRYDAAFLIVSEIRRGKDGYAAREDAFKESGGIEYGADLALTLNRAAADEDNDEGASTLRVELARDAEEDPRGEVASYRQVRPFYGLEEIDPVPVQKRRGRPASKREGAAEFLRGILSTTALEVVDIYRQGRASGYSESTMKRAKEEIGALSCTVNCGSGWRLP